MFMATSFMVDEGIHINPFENFYDFFCYHIEIVLQIEIFDRSE